jgi:hypothetical protein
VRELTTKVRNVIRVQIGKLKVGDQVKTATERFGEQYAEGKPKYTFGEVKKIKGQLAAIQWQREKRRMNADVAHLVRVKGASLMFVGNDGLDLALPTYSLAPDPEGLSSIDEYVERNKEMFDRLEEDLLKDIERFKKDNNFQPGEWIARTILPIMEVGASISGNEMGGSWPKDFYGGPSATGLAALGYGSQR